MKYEKNTRILAEWAKVGTFNGPDGGKHIGRLRELNRPEDEPERVNVIMEMFNDALGHLETVPLWPEDRVPGWSPSPQDLAHFLRFLGQMNRRRKQLGRRRGEQLPTP